MGVAVLSGDFCVWDSPRCGGPRHGFVIKTAPFILLEKYAPFLFELRYLFFQVLLRTPAILREARQAVENVGIPRKQFPVDSDNVL